MGPAARGKANNAISADAPKLDGNGVVIEVPAPLKDGRAASARHQELPRRPEDDGDARCNGRQPGKPKRGHLRGGGGRDTQRQRE